MSEKQYISPGPYMVYKGKWSEGSTGWPIASLGVDSGGVPFTIMSAPCHGDSLGDIEAEAQFICDAMNEKRERMKAGPQ